MSVGTDLDNIIEDIDNRLQDLEESLFTLTNLTASIDANLFEVTLRLRTLEEKVNGQ